jgi:hypothetical protein
MSDDEVISVWGRISRRELFARLAGASALFGSTAIADAFGQLSPPRDGMNKPHLAQMGQTFRPFTMPQGDAWIKAKGKFKNDRLPKVRRRDAFWYSKPNAAYGFNIFQYTQSVNHPSNSCAQAACATLLHKFGKVPAGLSGDAVTDRIFQTHPPDVASGTYAQTLAKAVKDYGLNCWLGYGAEYGADTIKSTLRQWVAAGYPCAVLLDMRPPLGQSADSAFTGHWVVIFAYDDNESTGYVYPTNWDYKKWKNSWPVFKQAWSLNGYPSHAYPLLIGWA